MAALLKKRALAQYTQVIQLEEPPPPAQKKLRLVRRQKSQVASVDFDVTSSHTSQDVLALLLTISEKQPSEDAEKKELISKLAAHYHKEQEPVVRVKLINLICDLQIQLVEFVPASETSAIIDDLCGMLKTEKSHKVKAQLITSLHRFGSISVMSSQLTQKLLSLAKQNLGDRSHLVQCCCLKVISELSLFDSNADDTVRLIGQYIHCQESRVRCCSLQSMITLHERGFSIDVNLYEKVCSALHDDYEGARQVALCLLKIFGQLYPEHPIPIANSSETNRLVDDAFSKICHAINDLSMQVRTQAASLLGTISNVSPEFLEQTLDKKLMSNMRRKRSAHERQNESYQTGEWSSGKKWNDDAPKEEVSEESVSLLNSGTCGAFVHGLEDEFLEVRSAALDSVCALALTSRAFAQLSLDFIVDMFNDEIEDVRLKAIHCLTKINSVIVLREDQIETMLSVLEDFSMDIREALHRMLASCNLSTQQCLKLCISSLLENLSRYPQDKHSIWRCLQKLGRNHPELTLLLVPEILAIHPFFDVPEPSVEDPTYISKLILVFNAAVNSPTMLPLFEEHTLHHYSYLRHSLASYVPTLQIPGTSSNSSAVATATTDNTANFLHQIMSRVSSLCGSNMAVRQSIQETAMTDLEKLAEFEPSLSAASHCAAMFIQCQLLFSKILACKNNMTMVRLPLTNTIPITTTVEELVKKAFCLAQSFGGLTEKETACIMQLYNRALALQLTFIVNTSNTSALSLCDNFLDHVELLQSYLLDHNIKPDAFTEALFTELSKIEDPKPGAVARLTLPLLTSNEINTIQFDGQPRNRINEVTAKIDEPTGDNENPLSFTAGLVLGVNLDAQICNIENIKQIKVKIKYPDQQTQLILPRVSDFRPQEGAENTYRLLTSILLSHSSWSESCHIELSLVLDVSESQSKRVGSAMILDLCKPVKVNIAPKPPRRGM